LATLHPSIHIKKRLCIIYASTKLDEEPLWSEISTRMDYLQGKCYPCLQNRLI